MLRSYLIIVKMLKKKSKFYFQLYNGKNIQSHSFIQSKHKALLKSSAVFEFANTFYNKVAHWLTVGEFKILSMSIEIEENNF